jgi:uncharacterized protein YbjT (DUF2867 family)
MITIVGGTGRLGRLVAARLVTDGHPVRLVGRHVHEGLPGGTEFVAADVRRPESLAAAVARSDVVVSAVQGVDPTYGESPAEVDRDGNLALIRAARGVGADIVLLSSIDASPGHPIELMRMKSAAEQELHSGEPGRVDWTVVRPTAYVELWAEVMRQTAGHSGVPKVLGKGVNPVNFVAVGDVAAAVHRAVVDPSLRGVVIDVGGPENLTMTELARLVTGQPKVAHIPRAALRTMSFLMSPVRPAQARLARMALQMDTIPMAFDPTPTRGAHPWLPCTPVAEALARSSTVA